MYARTSTCLGPLKSLGLTPSYKRAIVLVVSILVLLVVLLNSCSLSTGSHLLSDDWTTTEGWNQVQYSGDWNHERLTKQLAAIFPYQSSSEFPALVWQTWKKTPLDADRDEALFSAHESWQHHNPEYEHQLVDDKVARFLIHQLYANAPWIKQAYDALPEPVLKADFFRYLILLARGGVYSDIDTTALKPISKWVPEEPSARPYGLVVGIEADPDRPDWPEWYARRIQFCQWTIQSKPGHPVLIDIVAAITLETLQGHALGQLDATHMKSVMDFTGPGIWTDTLFEYFRRASVRGNVTWHTFANLTRPAQVADVVVLPITAFSPGVGHMGSQPVSDPMACVSHAFTDSWRKTDEKKVDIREDRIEDDRIGGGHADEGHDEDEEAEDDDPLDASSTTPRAKKLLRVH